MHCLSRLIAGACCCYGVWLINNVIKLFYLRECIFMVTLWKGWFTHWNSRELVCVHACESFCWAPCAVLGGHGQWPVSVSCTTDKKESFRFAVSYYPKFLSSRTFPACEITQVVPEWICSVCLMDGIYHHSLYYICITTSDVILESGLGGERGVITSWDVIIFLEARERRM